MICQTLETAHASVVQLVHDFAANEAYYLSAGYSEAQARISFIDKFWAALGWDVKHEVQKNPYAQEVKVEDPLKISGSSRRADYAFHTAPNFRDARFFCEAKKPAVQLKTDSTAAFQTIRYGWSAGTPLAVLTDFEQLHVLDCRKKPNIDTALGCSLRLYHYKEWLNRDTFAEIYYIFSREAFASGAFDTYVDALPRPKKVAKQSGAAIRSGQQPVDAAFLQDLEQYRETLADLLKKSDRSLDGEALTEMVQRILDRLILIRFLEDKLIETEVQVQQFANAPTGRSWESFVAASRKMDQRYNGIVFKYSSRIDDLSRPRINDERFAKLCHELSHTRSPYDFNAIPIHILGSIYERFLGKVIVTTAAGVRVEDKPQVRKAGGVYYTPEYIVRYIVQQTVGRMIAGKSPGQISKMRFADVSCGSGSFLLGIYECILDAHLSWYQDNRSDASNENLAPPSKKKKKRDYIPAVVERQGTLSLSFEKRRQILTNNIFGVDLDGQAVEVAQLSLYLKLLEDETATTARQHYFDFHEALLPTLSANVIRGNSLVGSDFLSTGNVSLSPREEAQISPMDFARAFPKCMSEGGFDAIVGNPPYVFTREMIAESFRLYYSKTYKLGWEKQNTYMLFMEKILLLLKSNGLASLIVPNSWLTIESAKLIRAHYLERLVGVVDMNYPAFDGVSMEPSIFIVDASPLKKDEDVGLARIQSAGDFPTIRLIPTSRPKLQGHNRIVFHSSHDSTVLVEKLIGTSRALGDLFDLRSGLQAYERGRGTPPQSAQDVRDHVFDRADRQDKHSVRYLEGRDVRRYAVAWSGSWMQYGPWLSQPREIGIFSRPRILLREITAKLPYALNFAYSSDKFLNNKSVLNILDIDDNTNRLIALLGVLNSSLISYYYNQHSVKSGRKLFPKVVLKDLGIFPIPAQIESVDGDHPIVKAVSGRMVAEHHLAAATGDVERGYFDGKVAALDDEIDELVFGLYGLSSEECNVVRTIGSAADSPSSSDVN